MRTNYSRLEMKRLAGKGGWDDSTVAMFTAVAMRTGVLHAKLCGSDKIISRVAKRHARGSELPCNGAKVEALGTTYCSELCQSCRAMKMISF